MKGSGDGKPPFPPVRRRTIGDKLLRFARQVFLGAVATLLVGWLILIIWLPIRVHKKLVVPAEPVIEVAEESEVPDELRELYRRLATDLAEAGFEEIGWLRSDGLTPDTVSFMGLVRHDDERVIGLAGGVVRETEAGAVLDDSYLELSTELTDGRELMTNNSDAMGTFHPRPERLIASFIEIDDPLELYRLHLKGLSELGTVARSPLPAPGDLTARLERDAVELFEGQVEEGYFYRDAESRTFRVTWKGAMIMSWKHVWPLSLVL